MLKRSQYNEIWKKYRNNFWRCIYMLSKNIAPMISYICVANQKVGTGMWKPVQEVQIYLGEPNSERDLFLVIEQESTCDITQCPVHIMCMFNAIEHPLWISEKVYISFHKLRSNSSFNSIKFTTFNCNIKLGFWSLVK